MVIFISRKKETNKQRIKELGQTNNLPRGTTWKAKLVLLAGLLVFFCLSENTTLQGLLFVLGRPHPCLQSCPMRSKWEGRGPEETQWALQWDEALSVSQLQGRCPHGKGP